MMEALQVQRTVRRTAEGVRIAEFALEGTDLICPYFHQRVFTPDSQRFVCYGEFDGNNEAVLIEIETGDAWRLTEGGAHVHTGDLEPGGRRFYFVRDGVVFSVDMETGEESAHFPLPTDGGYECLSMVHFNADGTRIAVGANREHASGVKQGCVFAIDVAIGDSRIIIERPFQIGHVQWSTVDPDLVMYCHETGGSSPQRIWLARTAGKHPGALFDRPGHPWVTHETFTGDGGEVVFIRHPDGIGIIRPDNSRFEPIDAPGAWHPGPNRDASVIVHDTHKGEVRLHWRETGRSVLLSTDELATANNHPHPRFSPDERSVIWTSNREAPSRPAVADVSDLPA